MIPLPNKRNTLKAHYINEAWQEAKKQLQYAIAALSQHFQAREQYPQARRLNELQEEIQHYGQAWPYDMMEAYGQAFTVMMGGGHDIGTSDYLHLFWKHMALFGKALLTADKGDDR